MSTGLPAALRAEIRRTRERTARPFAVNLAIGHVPIEPYLDVALEEGVAAISVTGGNPEAALRPPRGPARTAWCWSPGCARPARPRRSAPTP